MATKQVTINDYYDIDYYVYADLDDAIVYNTAIVGSTWLEQDEETQKKYLVMATRKIDSYSYAGTKVDNEQPLKFPRVMNNGKVSDDKILIQLCCQLASFYNDSNKSSSSESSNSSAFLNNVENYQIGDLHVKFKDDATIDLNDIDDMIEKALKDWLKSQGMEIWL